MRKAILNYILFRDLENKELSLLRIVMSILGTFSFVIFLTLEYKKIENNDLEFYSFDLLWCYLFIATLLFYRKNITKKFSIRIIMGFFSLFSNLFISIWILFFSYFLLPLALPASGRYIISDFILSIINASEKSKDLTIGLIFYSQFFILIFQLQKILKRDQSISS